jgi:ABC-type glycerol-3-phosphate transport system substrate-binding protein
MEEVTVTEKHITRREFLSLLGAAGGAAVLTSCVPVVTPAPTQAPAATQAPETAAQAKMLTYINDMPPFAEIINKMGSLSAGEVGVGFQSESYPDLTNYQTTLRQSLQNPKTAPDFFKWWSGYRLKELVDQDLLVDVTPIWQKHIDAGEWDQSAAEFVTYDGKSFGLPFHYSYWGILYNKPVFEKLGLEEPKTWADLMMTAEEIKKSGGTPFATTLEGRWQSLIWWEEVLVKTDPDLYVGVCEQTIDYADPKVIEALQPWADLARKGYFPEDMLAQWQGVYGDLVKGEYAMYLIGDWLVGPLEGLGATMGEDIDWFHVPAIDPEKGNGTIAEMSPWAIPKASPNVEDTLKVADYWLSAEAQTEWAKIFNAPTPNKKATNPDYPIIQKIVASGLLSGEYRFVQRYWENTPVPIVEFAIDKFGEVMLNPDKLEVAMKDIDEFRKTLN